MTDEPELTTAKGLADPEADKATDLGPRREPSVPGGLARAMHDTPTGALREEFTDTPPIHSYPSPVDPHQTVHPLHYGELRSATALAPTSVNRGHSVTNKFPETLHVMMQPEGETLEIEAGAVRATLTQVTGMYFDLYDEDRTLIFGGDQQKAHSFILKVGGQKIFIHPPNPNEAITRINDNGVTDLIELLNKIPDLPKSTFDNVVAKARTAATNTQPEKTPEEKAVGTPIRIHFYGADHKNPKSGQVEEGIVIEPEYYGSGTLRWVQDIEGIPTEAGDPIPRSGGIIFPEDGKSLHDFKGPQFTLEIMGSRVTVVDGDGYGRNSQQGSRVILHSNSPSSYQHPNRKPA